MQLFTALATVLLGLPGVTAVDTFDAATPESQYLGSGVAPSVIGGQDATVAEFPYVILGTRQGGPRPQGASCTGSVVAPRKVLIAAHCKDADGTKRFLYGLDNFGDPTGGIWAEVVDYKQHPSYVSPNGWQTGYDVAVVTLDRDIQLKGGAAYPRVAGSNDSGLSSVGRTSSFAGYGRIALDENTSSKLKKVSLPIVDGANACKSFLPSYNPAYMICTGYADGHDGICQGDSGGGLLVDGVVIGVASFVKTGCNSYSGFARLTNAMGDWVNGELGGGTGPTASFTASCPTLTCSFDASGSTGSISTYGWDFGDGTSGNGVKPSHTYGSGGTYTVKLTVTDDKGKTADTTRNVTVGGGGGQPPTASFFVFCQQSTCTFDGSFSRDPDGTIASYAWNFGDGSTGSGVKPSHTYPNRAGNYTVKLTVTDNSGNSASVNKPVTCWAFGSGAFCFGG